MQTTHSVVCLQHRRRYSECSFVPPRTLPSSYAIPVTSEVESFSPDEMFKFLCYSETDFAVVPESLSCTALKLKTSDLGTIMAEIMSKSSLIHFIPAPRNLQKLFPSSNTTTNNLSKRFHSIGIKSSVLRLTEHAISSRFIPS